jgi:hypothetical protein
LRSGDTNHPGGFEIFSITNPAAPAWLGGYESRSEANAIRIAGHYAYLAVGATRTVTNDPGYLEIIDVNDLSNPVRVGRADTFGRANSVRVEGTFAYLPESTRWTGSNLLGALEIFDVSTPTNPNHKGTYYTGASAISVDVSGGLAYLADGVTDLRVLDVSVVANPTSVGVYDVDERTACAAEFARPASFIRVVSNLVFSAGENGLHVLDVSTPANPVRVGGHCPLPFISAFDISGLYVCESIYSSAANSFLLSVSDLGNPTNWVLVALSVVFAEPRAIQVAGNCVYLGTNPMLVYEMSQQPLIKSISISNEYLTLTWDYAPGFVLQHTSSLDNPAWSDVPDSEDRTSIELLITNSNGFFRLAKP